MATIGLVAMAGVMGTFIGPFVFGLSYDYLGSYNPSLWLGIVLALLAVACAVLVKKPKYSTLT